jgi:hypothetical protein
VVEIQGYKRAVEIQGYEGVVECKCGGQDYIRAITRGGESLLVYSANFNTVLHGGTNTPNISRKKLQEFIQKILLHDLHNTK